MVNHRKSSSLGMLSLLSQDKTSRNSRNAIEICIYIYIYIIIFIYNYIIYIIGIYQLDNHMQRTIFTPQASVSSWLLGEDAASTGFVVAASAMLPTSRSTVGLRTWTSWEEKLQVGGFFCHLKNTKFQNHLKKDANLLT